MGQHGPDHLHEQFGSLANGLWMLFAPAHWYQNLPAGVPDTGPLNVHFVRDIGAAFATASRTYAAVASSPDAALPSCSPLPCDGDA